MKKLIIPMVFILFGLNTVYSQKYITKTGEIEIFSKTSLFTIEAVNKSVASILNTENGEIVVSTLVRSFDFEEELVEEHFNENYMESHKYPKASFKGNISDWGKVDISKDGAYDLIVEGDLTLHGTTVKISEPVKIAIKEGKIVGNSTFIVSLKAHDIEVEENYKDRIKDEVELNVHFEYNPYK